MTNQTAAFCQVTYSACVFWGHYALVRLKVVGILVCKALKVAVRGRGRLVTDRRGVAIRSVPLVPQSTALLFSLRYLRSGLSSSNLKFADFLHCACSVSTPGSRLTFSILNGLSQIGARLPGVDTEHAQ